MKRVSQFLALMVFSHAMAAVDYSTSLEQKARSGDHQAQMDLAIVYEQGRGVPKDERKAMEWFQKARQGGYPDQELAQLNQQRVALASSRIEIAVQTYRTQNGDRLPTSLAELSSSGILTEAPQDPWGREIAYIPSPDGKTYSLFSVGPDGAPKTSDDIVALQSGPSLDVETAAGSEEPPMPWWKVWLVKIWSWLTFWRR
jgi:Sel1 repeat/Type II secretion system (T2SS), protein G